MTQEEIAEETRILIRQGHKRVLVVAGEALPPRGFEYITDSIATIYDTRVGPGEIRRVNVNLAPQNVERFKLLKEAGIGTFQLFQETYHRPTYAAVHLKGKKRDYDWRATAFDRAMEAGIDDVGMGVALRTLRLALRNAGDDAAHPASGRDLRRWPAHHQFSAHRAGGWFRRSLPRPPHAVSDADFLKMIAIMRLAVPYTGMIMSTRETAEVRRQRSRSASRRFQPAAAPIPADTRMAKAIPMAASSSWAITAQWKKSCSDVVSLGYTPSFCTACYRLGRTGQDFMDLAKPGEIKYHCQPNALSTFLEYLCDYAGPVAKSAGEKLISIELQQMDNQQTACTLPMLNQVRRGERDVFV